MAVFRVLVLVLLLCLSKVVKIESKVLQREQSLTEISDSAQQDTVRNSAAKKYNTRNNPLLGRRNPLSKAEEIAVDLVEDGNQPEEKKTKISSGNVYKLGFLSKEEAYLVDQDVNKVLNNYGFQKKNEIDNESAKKLGPQVANIGLNYLKNSRAEYDKYQKTKHSMKNTAKIEPMDTRLLKKGVQDFYVNLQLKKELQHRQNTKQEMHAGKAQNPKVLLPKKVLDRKLGHEKLFNKNSLLKVKKNTKMENLRVLKAKTDLSQQKNVIHKTSLMDKTVKNGYQSLWLPLIKDNVKLFNNDELEALDKQLHAKTAKAALEYLNMPNKDVLKLVQNDAVQALNPTKESRGGVDIVAPDWLPVKDIHGIQFDMSQGKGNKMTHSALAAQNDTSQKQGNKKLNPIHEVQHGGMQALKNGRPNLTHGMQNRLSQKPQKNLDNDWLPIKIDIDGLQFGITQDEVNKKTNSNDKIKINIGTKNDSFQALNSMEADNDGNTTASEHHNSPQTTQHLDESTRNGQLQNVTYKTTQQHDFEGGKIQFQDNLNVTMPRENSKANFNQIKSEQDVSKQVWSSGKVIRSHREESQHMTLWSPWSTCSETCGTNGLRIRTRKCTHAQEDHPACNNDTVDWKWCVGVVVCPEPGLRIVNHDTNATYAAINMEGEVAPSQWGSWSTCSKRCGTESLSVRTRKCIGQREKDTGVCNDPTMQWTWCKPVPCKVDKAKHKGMAFSDGCTISPWSKWSKCSKTCGENSFKFRRRSCNCGYKVVCTPATVERQHCGLKTCQGEENYGPWSLFSQCTKSCDGGWKKRTRRCKKVDPNGRFLCDQELLIGVKICNAHTCHKVSDGGMVANVKPRSMCGFNPCEEFGCIDNPDSKCLADTSCNPVFFNQYGQKESKCAGWQRYQVKNPTLYCGYDPCARTPCQQLFGRCSVDLDCKPYIQGADGSLINCNQIQNPY